MLGICPHKIGHCTQNCHLPALHTVKARYSRAHQEPQVMDNMLLSYPIRFPTVQDPSKMSKLSCTSLNIHGFTCSSPSYFSDPTALDPSFPPLVLLLLLKIFSCSSWEIKILLVRTVTDNMAGMKLRLQMSSRHSAR